MFLGSSWDVPGNEYTLRRMSSNAGPRHLLYAKTFQLSETFQAGFSCTFVSVKTEYGLSLKTSTRDVDQFQNDRDWQPSERIPLRTVLALRPVGGRLVGHVHSIYISSTLVRH